MFHRLSQFSDGLEKSDARQPSEKDGENFSSFRVLYVGKLILFS